MNEIIATPKPLDYRAMPKSVINDPKREPRDEAVAAPSDLNYAGGPTL